MKDCAVLDIGSEFIKAGLASASEPKIFTSTLLKKNRKTNPITFKAIWGREAWEDFSALFTHLIDTEIIECKLNNRWMIPQSFNVPKTSKEKMAQVLFEEFGISELSMPDSSPLPLYDINRTTGIVVDIGSSITEVSAICDGRIAAQKYRNLGGKQITQLLLKQISERCIYLNHSVYTETVRTIKERACCVVLNYEDELKETQTNESKYEQTYRLPDGKKIQIANERFRAPEILFQPDLEVVEGYDQYIIDCASYDNPKNVSRMIADVIKEVTPTLREKLFSNICIAGGTSEMRGLPERLCSDLKFLIAHNVKILAPPNRSTSVWRGAVKLLAMDAGYGGHFVTQAEYDEFGPDIVHKAC